MDHIMSGFCNDLLNYQSEEGNRMSPDHYVIDFILTTYETHKAYTPETNTLNLC